MLHYMSLIVTPIQRQNSFMKELLTLVKLLKQKRPEVPVLLVEGFYYVSGFGDPKESDKAKKNVELQRAYQYIEKIRD